MFVFIVFVIVAFTQPLGPLSVHVPVSFKDDFHDELPPDDLHEGADLSYLIVLEHVALFPALSNISFAFLFLGYVFFGLFRHISRKRKAMKLRRARR